MANSVNIPNPERLIEILRSPGAPPHLMIDVGGSEFDGDGVIYVAVDSFGNLIEVEP